MKKNKIFSLLAAGVTLSIAACNNSGTSTSTNDSTNTNNTTVTNTSTGNYAARADSVKANVQAGYYLNPRTGKAYTRLTVDPNTGMLTDETGMPVRRYVDTRTWWVYDTNTWDTIGSAEMQNNNLLYRDASGSWVPYDKRWAEDMNNGTTNMNDTASTMNNTNTDKNTKIKVSDNGKKIKIKKSDKQ